MRKHFPIIFILLCFLIPQINSLSAQKTTIPVDESVRIGVLANGMHYYIQKNSKPENRAELRLALNAGAIQEDENQLGLAHFVEHMAFNGSENFDKNELVDYLESVGTKFGPDLNAYTSFDETVYMLQVRTDDEEMFDKGMLVMRDWAGGLTFDHEEIDKERGVVMSEWRTRLSPEERMQKVYFPIMYQNARYAKRLPIGSPEIIEKAKYETVKKFYTDWYRPNLMALVVVGDVDVDQIEKDIKKQFGALKNPKNERERVEYSVPMHEETLVAVCSDEEAAFTRVRLMYKHPHIAIKTMDDLRQSYVRRLYGEMINNRLRELSQGANPPFTFAYSGYSQNVGDIDAYTSFAMVSEGQSAQGLEVLVEENERVLRHGFVVTEFERAKTEVMKGAERAFKEKDKTDSRGLSMKYVYNFLDENPILSAGQRLDFVQEVLPGIQLKEVNGLAKKWLTVENRVVIITSPKKEELDLPSEAAVMRILEEVKTKKIETYVDEVSDEPLFTAKLSPVKMLKHDELEDLGITKILLENGVKVYLKQTNFKNDEIRLSATSPGGSSLYDDEMYKQANYAARIINESGIGNFDKSQLEKKMTGKKVSVSPYISGREEGFYGNASPDDAETMMQLIYLYFTAPRKDKTALTSYVSKQKGIYENLMQNPQYYFMNETMQIQFDNHPRVGFPTAETLDALDIDKVFKIYKERFENAGDFTFFFVGNFEKESFTKLVQTYLGNLPSTGRVEKWIDRKSDYVEGVVEKSMSKGKAPKTYVDITYHGKAKWTGKNRYTLQSLADVMRIKLRESLREDKGGVYGVRVSSNFSQFPSPAYNINISFNCDPGNTEILVEAAMNVIAEAQKIGAEEKDMTKIKETQRQSRVKNLKENRYWIRGIENAVENGDKLEGLTLKALEMQIEKLTASDIKTAAGQFFDGNNMIKITMKPAEEETN